MSSSKVALICGLIATLFLTGCGIVAKPDAGTPHLLKAPGFHGKYDDQRSSRATCLHHAHIKYHKFLTKNEIDGTPQLLQAIKIGDAPSGATIIFYPEAEVAEGQQIMGQGEGAELIGSALLYPNQTSGEKLTKVENCVSAGVGQ